MECRENGSGSFQRVLNRFGGAVGQSVASAGLLDHFLIVLVILAAVFYIRE
jgi:hypothetical protein